jgi:hypothetical protein
MRIDRPEHYYQAAQERMNQAWILYGHEEGESYALAMYVGGLAVECMLRAFKARSDRVFDERYQLLDLFKASGMLDVDPDPLRSAGLSDTEADGYTRGLRSAVNNVWLLRKNELRYASEERMRAELKSNRLDRKIRGDYLKANTLKLLDSAQTLIDKGAFQWTWSRKSKLS